MKKLFLSMLSVVFLLSACSDSDDNKEVTYDSFVEESVDYDTKGLDKYETDNIVFYSSENFNDEFEMWSDDDNILVMYSTYEDIADLSVVETKVTDLESYYDSYLEEQEMWGDLELFEDEDYVMPKYEVDVSKEDIETRGVKGYKITTEMVITNFDDLDPELSTLYTEEDIETTIIQYVYADDNGLLIIYDFSGDGEDVVEEIQETVYIKVEEEK